MVFIGGSESPPADIAPVAPGPAALDGADPGGRMRTGPERPAGR